MPLSSSQRAALGERAKAKAPPLPSPPSRQHQAVPATPPPTTTSAARPVQRFAPAPPTPRPPPRPAPPPPSPAAKAAEPEPAIEPIADDFPKGWQLMKESWNFHPRFYPLFRRPMRQGEYSHLLWQVR